MSSNKANYQQQGEVDTPISKLADFRSENLPSFDDTNKSWLWVTVSFTLRGAMPTALNSQNT
ncbi:MAG: hypothetical protein O3A05_10440 [Proteobacteria bacterium]|nr:hypothetical protein [Pseudomonadota bacterium]